MTQFVSPSKLKSFRACPRRCFDEPYTPSEAAHFGTALHAAAASLARGDAKSVEDAAKVFADTFERLGESALFTPENARRGGDSIYNIMNHRKVALNPENVLEVESADAAKVFNDGSGKRYHEVEIVEGKWGLRVMIDLVDVIPTNVLRILDWKSGRTVEEDDIQTASYALAAHRLYPGFGQIETAYFYAEQGRDGWYDATTWDSESMRAAKETIGALVKEFLEAKRDGRHDERLNKNCGYCALRSDCATYRERTKVIPTGSAWNAPATVESFPTILAYLEQISAIKKAAEDIESELTKRRNAVLAEHGVIQIDGYTYARTEKVSRYEYNASEIFNEIGKAIGRPPLEIIETSATRIDECLKTAFPARGDATRKALDQFVKDNRTPKTKSIQVKKTLAKEIPAQIEAPEAEEAKQE
jgi:hypothetical protein